MMAGAGHLDEEPAWTGLFPPWNNAGVLDLNDLRVFEAVARLQSFSAAARELGQPKSSVSRAVGRLEKVLGMRLLQRTTRQVALTQAGELMLARCNAWLGDVDKTLELVGAFTGRPRGLIRIACGVGFGVNVLGRQLPEFLDRFPEVDVDLDLRTEVIDLVSDGVDVAIRLGPLPDSNMVKVALGSMTRHLCASPDYVSTHPAPDTVAEITAHHAVDMPGVNGRPRAWTFTRGKESAKVELKLRVAVNEALTIHRLVLGGAGLGILSGYVCEPDLAAGRLVEVLPDWSPPRVPVNMVFPSRREMSPAVRAFVEFMKEATSSDGFWLRRPATAS
jgi:LysR family transcriptional regulator, regulator for bpeEF and oprC